MIVSPNHLNTIEYTDLEYKKLTEKFCEVGSESPQMYFGLMEYCLKYEYSPKSLIDEEFIGHLVEKMNTKIVNDTDFEIFLNSVFLEIVRPHLLCTVRDLIEFLEDFPHKECLKCTHP